MATVPATHTFSDGLATSSEQNSFVRDPLNFLLKPPTAELTATAAQSIPNAVATAIAFPSETYDSDVDGVGGHDNVTNNSRFVARYAGRYEVSGNVTFATNATGIRAVHVAVNGVSVASQGKIAALAGGINTGVICATVQVFLNVGDYVELLGFQNSTAALNTAVGTTEEQPHMSVRWVGTS